MFTPDETIVVQTDRSRYHQLMEPHPSRFSREGKDDQEWASRADAWAAERRQALQKIEK